MRNLALWLQVRDLAAEQRRLQASRGGPAVTRGPYSTAVQVSRRTPTAEAMTGGTGNEAAARIVGHRAASPSDFAS
jgi:hypothetical protein